MYQTTINSAEIAKDELGFPGVAMQLLSGDGNQGGMYVMTTMLAGATIPAHSHSGANEFVYVISGDFVEAGVTHGPGTVFFGVAGTAHGPHSTKTGCVVLSHFSAPLDFVPAT
jgi:quercetin dioxygenase-like cupin family protein